MIRKRTHHLERTIWHPQAHSLEEQKLIFADLKGLEKNPRLDSVTKRILAWSRRIQREYDRGDHCDADDCPVWEKKVRRKDSPVATESLMKLLKMRRSRRLFENTPLSQGERELITEASQWAPSSCNRQTVELIFVEDPRLKNWLSKTIPGGYQFFHEAPAIVIVLSDSRDYRYPQDRNAGYIDAAASVQNIFLVCETMNLGVCWGSYTSFGNVLRESEVREKLKIPDTHIIVASLAIGKSEQFVCEIPRDEPEKRYGIDSFRANI